MKKLLVLLSAILLIFAVSCDNSTSSPSVPDTPDVPVVTPPSEEETQPIPQNVLTVLNTIGNAADTAEPVKITGSKMTIGYDRSGQIVYAGDEEVMNVYKDLHAPSDIPSSIPIPEGYFDGVVIKAGEYKLSDGGYPEGFEPDTLEKMTALLNLLRAIGDIVVSGADVQTVVLENVEIDSGKYDITLKATHVSDGSSSDVISYEYVLNAAYKGIDHFIRYRVYDSISGSTEITYTVIGGEYAGNYTDEVAGQEPGGDTEEPIVIENGDPIAEEIMTPFLAFFNGKEAGTETGEITASAISWTVTSDTGYEIDGKVTTDFPVTHLLEKAKPVIKKLPGWNCDIRGIPRQLEMRRFYCLQHHSQHPQQPARAQGALLDRKRKDLNIPFNRPQATLCFRHAA